MTHEMTTLTAALSAALLHFVWQGTAVALLLWVLLVLLRKRSARARYAVSCAALVLLAVLPAITACILYDSPRFTMPAGTLAIRNATGNGLIPTAQPAVSWLYIAQQWTLSVWALGVAVFSLRVIRCWGQTALVRRRGQTAEPWLILMVGDLGRRMGVTQRISVLISGMADGPGVIGWLRPVILIPASAIAGLTPQQFEAVLAHELAHIRRADYLINLCQLLIETLLFYHPAVWWISGQIRAERELCCDDLAVQTCGDALTYARALSILEKLRLAVAGFALGSTGSSGSSLLYRIRRLAGAQNPPVAPSKLPAVVALMVALAFGVMDFHGARAQAPPPVQASTVSAPQAPAAPGITTAPARDNSGPKLSPVPPHSERTNGSLERSIVALEAQVADLRYQLELMASKAPSQDLSSLQEQLRIARTQLALMQQMREGPSPGELKSQRRLMEEFFSDQIRERQLAIASMDGQKQVAGDTEIRSRLEQELTEMRALLTGIQLKASLVSPELNPQISKIVVTGVSADVRNQILALLPIHEGATLSDLMLRDGFAEVSRFDKNLEFAIVLIPGGQAEIRIAAPSSRP